MIIMPVHHAPAIPANTLVKQLYSDRHQEDGTGKKRQETQQSNVPRPGSAQGDMWGMRLHSEGAIDVL